MDWQTVWLTVKLAFVTTVVLLSFGIPLAWWLASGRGVARTCVEAIAGVPLLLPPTVLGFYLLIVLGPTTTAGRLLTAMLGHPLAFSFSGLVLGSVVYSLPFAVQPMVAGFRAVDREYLDAARVLGAGPVARFVTIGFPLARPAAAAAAVLCFTHTVGEFGVVLMVGGNIPGVTHTLSIALFDQVQDFNYAAANRTAGLLVGFAAGALMLLYGTQARRRSGVLGNA